MPDALPLCMQDCGCPIEALASDMELSRVCAEYMRARQIKDMCDDPEPARRFYAAHNFYDDLESFFDIERIFLKWKHQEQTKRRHE